MIPRIHAPYLLALFGVSVYEVNGGRYLDRLWAQDLKLHAEYIPDLTLFCYSERPAEITARKDDLVRIDDCPLLSKIIYVCVPKPRNLAHALWMLPRTTQTLWNCTKGAGIVHGAVAGWPIPVAWFLLPMQIARGFFSLILVESAPWRSLGAKRSIPRRFWRAITEKLNVLCVRAAHLPIFTHEGYRRSMLSKEDHRGIVIPAAWINEKDILDDGSVDKLAQERMRRPNFRLVYAGRLTTEKGIDWLVQALKNQRHIGQPVELDVFGAGPLEESVRAAMVERPDLRIRFLGTLAYGEDFFAVLRGYDALVLPTLTDEQPRILFDAYSQGLPVIASATEGVADFLVDERHGIRFKVGDQADFTMALDRFQRLRPRWGELARNCVDSAKRMTHQEMHRLRVEVLNKSFSQHTSRNRSVQADAGSDSL
jgi:glycosyltransferase involved in cell wall biosynthesis